MIVTPTLNLTSAASIVALYHPFGYLITMTRSDVAVSYCELSKYVQFPGIAHMEAAEHVLHYLYDT